MGILGKRLFLDPDRGTTPCVRLMYVDTELPLRGASPAEKRRVAITIGWSGDGGRPQARDSPGGELWDGAGRAAEKAAAKEPEGREAGRQEQLAQAQDGVQLVQQLELRQRMRMPGGLLVVRFMRV